MRMQNLVVLSAIGLSLLLGGCTENDQSIYRTVDLSKGSTLLTDAKTRTVLNLAPASGSSPGYIIPSRIICAEPSPDVAQAVSKSFGAELSAAVASEGSGQAQVAAAQAASIAELGKRLAAVQALRDGLYRACEAYANGAITDASYAAILGGYRTTLETTLFGDFLASRDSASAVASAGGNASTTGSANENSATIKQRECWASLDDSGIFDVVHDTVEHNEYHFRSHRHRKRNHQRQRHAGDGIRIVSI